MKSTELPKKILILPDIRSSQNVGSLFRTADAVGVQYIYLVGITPTPVDRFGRPNAALIKTSLGAQDSVAWEQQKDLSTLIADLKARGVIVVAIEQSPWAVDYKKVTITQPVAFILGNEVEGISENILSSCDVVAEIPMNGSKESLNVAVAGGVALFRMLDV